MANGILTLILALFAAALCGIIRYLAIDPGFGVWTSAAGRLMLWLAFGPRDLVYGDLDHLGKINDALTDPERGVIGHDRYNELMRGVRRQLRRADMALVYGGDELRWAVPPRTARGFCTRLQQLLRDAPLTEAERARVLEATGRPYLTITLSYASSQGVWTHRRALKEALLKVQAVKPKNAPGRRGEVIA